MSIAQRAEELGYDSLWVYDHVHNVPQPAHEAVFECWTTIAAISQRTTRIRLGQMVGCNSYRNPALLAKITSTVDVISGGRLDWGIGAGWYENEYHGYGYEFPAPKVRIGMLRETVEIVRRLWTEPETSYDGSYYRLHRAQCDPEAAAAAAPADLDRRRRRAAHAAGRRRATPTARTSAASPTSGRTSARCCRATAGHVGRDDDEIRKTWSPEVFIRETEAEVDEAGSRSLWGEPFERWRAGNLVGTPEQVAEKIQTYLDLGCTGFIPWCADYPGTETLERFATEVMPAVSRQSTDLGPMQRTAGRRYS